MNYIVLDTEFNQPTPKHFNPRFAIPTNEKCPFELIEIGGVKLNENFEQVDTFRIYIKPTIYKRLNPIISKKIKITSEDLKYGFKFIQAIEYFKKWIGDDYVICTWSDNDIRELTRNCKYYNLDVEWFSKFIDIQFETTKILELDNSISLKRAIERFQLDDNSKLHRALNDAIYTAKIFQIISNNKEFTYFSSEDVTD